MERDMIGQMLGHCRIVAKIGEGGMGAVYRAYDEVLHRDVAVKVVRKDSQIDSSSSKNLLQEARASSALAHPNICTIYEVGETEGELYIVMELLAGNGGLALHTVLLDPSHNERMYIAISSGGVYRTDDGGKSWTPQNNGVRATFMPNHYPEFGQCVHKISMHPARPERLFLQNHWGVYRSDDYAGNWTDIANGLPSDFGFAILVHPARPDWVYVVPVESDGFRCACDGRLRVYRTRNAGASWEPLTRGLPQKGAYETVVRDALVSDALDPVGLYFGTRSGQLFSSLDEGRSWAKVVEGFPSIVCIRSAVVGETSRQPLQARPIAPTARSRSSFPQERRQKKPRQKR